MAADSTGLLELLSAVAEQKPRGLRSVNSSRIGMSMAEIKSVAQVPLRFLGWLSLISALLLPGPAAAAPAAGSHSFWTYGAGPGSRHYWTFGNEEGSEYHWQWGNRPGSLHFWNWGSTAGSRWYWESGTGRGSRHYWEYERTPLSRYYWQTGTGPGSESFWLNGTTSSLGPVMTALCASGSLSIELCAPLQLDLAAEASNAAR
jgi:hypothetical protein